MKNVFVALTTLVLTLLFVYLINLGGFKESVDKMLSSNKDSKKAEIDDSFFEIEEQYTSLPEFLEMQDSAALISSKMLAQFDSRMASIYFIRSWNTPTFFANGQWSNLDSDGASFIGYRVNDKVYQEAHYYKFSTDKYRRLAACDSVKIETYFPADGVTILERVSLNWVVSLDDSVLLNGPIEKFVAVATCSEMLPKKIASSLIKDISAQIRQEEKPTNALKIISFTKNAGPITEPEFYQIY